MSTSKCALGVVGPRDQRSRSSDREMPQFQPRIPTQTGGRHQAWHRRMPKLWGAYSGRGGECAMVHGDGPASGQAGLDRQDKQDKPQKCAGGQGCVEEQELASKLKSKPWKDRSLHVPPSNHPTPFGNGCGGSRLRDGDCSTTRVGSEWALGSRNEGYSRRGGFSAASVLSDPLLRNTSIVPASSRTHASRGLYDDPVGSRQSTFSSCSHLTSAFELSIQATACWDIIAPTQYCSSAGHVPTYLPTCPPPKRKGMVSWGRDGISGTNRRLS